MTGNQRKISCKQCGRDIDVKLPLLVMQVIEMMGKHYPIRLFITWLAKCPYCNEMYGDEDSRYFEDTEELTADEFNALAAAKCPVMKQVVEPPGAEEEEADQSDDSSSRPHKIGFCSKEDE